MKITDALLGEHGLFYAYFDTLNAKLSAGDAAALRPLADALDGMLRAHATAEDDLLFPVMEAAMDDAGPLPMMIEEHQAVDRLLDEIKTAATDAEVGLVLGELMELVTEHFEKEEAVVFPAAEQFVDAATLTAMGRRWAAARNVRLSEVDAAA